MTQELFNRVMDYLLKGTERHILNNDAIKYGNQYCGVLYDPKSDILFYNGNTEYFFEAYLNLSHMQFVKYLILWFEEKEGIRPKTVI